MFHAYVKCTNSFFPFLLSFTPPTLSPVIDELGLSFQSDVPEALSTEVPSAQANKAAPQATPAGGPSNNSSNNNNNSGDDAGAGADGGGAQAGGGGGDPAMSELESRLNNLRR